MEPVPVVARSTIASRTVDCGRSLSRLYDLLITADKYADQIELPAAKDELGRFRVWAGNVGAHRTGRVSLDYRLREARDMYEGVTELLDDLKSVLQQANSILSGERQPYDEETFDSDSSDSTSDGGAGPANSSNPTTELQQIFHDVQKIIAYLYKLAVYFHNPAPHDRLGKLAKIDVSHFKEWDQRHVEEKFPFASPALRKRLGKANSKRRQLFKYHEKHHGKLVRNLDFTILTKPAPNPDPDGASTNPSTPNSPKLVPGIKTAPSTTWTTNTQTTVATFVETGQEVFIDDNLSETSSAASEGPDEGSTLHIPNPPRGALDGREFQCPYCYEMMKVSGSKSWRFQFSPSLPGGPVLTCTASRVHVLRDLQPYMCTFGSCTLPDHTFGTRQEWFDHEALIHRNEWFCNECPQKLLSRSSFEQHMQLKHSDSFADHQLPALAEMCARPIDKRVVGKCSLCLKEGQLLRSHLARHMRTLALFVLPRTNGEDDGDFKSDGAQVWGSEGEDEGGAGDANLSDSDKMSEISTEAMNEVPELEVEEMMQGHPQISAINDIDRTALSWAAEKGHVEEVRALVKNEGVDLNSRDGRGRTPLSWAAGKGYELVVRALLEYGVVDPDSEDSRGRTPLSWAAGEGHVAVVRTLLRDKRLNPDSKDNSNWTPLFWAAERGHDAVVKALLEHGADPSSKDKSGWTPLSWAANEGHETVVGALLEAEKVNPGCKDEMGSMPLFRAAERGHVEIVRTLLEHGRVDLDARDTGGRTPLSLAARGGHDAVVGVLLEYGADLNTEDSDGWTPLSWSARGGRVAAVKSLLMHGADPNSKDSIGWTPLSSAARYGHETAARVLLEHGADPDLKDNSGLAPLSLAAEGGHETAAKVLLEHGANPNAKDPNGWTPLSSAVENMHEAVARVLLEHGSDPNLRINVGSTWTPLFLAASSGLGAAADALLNRGANPNFRDDSGRMPLSLAARSGSEAAVRVLLAHGADPNSKDKTDRTPLTWALEGGHGAVVRVLLEHGARSELEG